jgi:hypothetical protein
MLNQTNPAALQSQVAALSERYSAAAMQDYFDILQRVDQFILSLTSDRTQLLLEQLRGNFLLSQAPSSTKANAVFEGFDGVNKRCNRAFGAADFMTRSVDTGQAVQIDAAKTLTLRSCGDRRTTLYTRVPTERACERRGKNDYRCSESWSGH